MLISLRCFFLVLLGSLSAVAGDIASPVEPQILVLNSYHKGDSWSDQIVDGIESNVLLQYPEAKLRVEYMDTKRNSSKDYMAELSDVYQRKFLDQKFDLIFASDDNAINYLMGVRKALFPGVPIVFCGANDQDTHLVWEGQENVTGVLEYADIRQTIALALQLQPNIKKLFVVNDRTITGNSIGRAFNRFLAENGDKFEITQLEDVPLEQLAQQLSQLPDDAIVLLLAYLRDKNGVYYDPAHTANILSKASSVPLYGVWDFYLGGGVLGGVITSGFDQGDAACNLVVAILKGQDVQSLPVIKKSPVRTTLDHEVMQEYGLEDMSFPDTVVVLNKPISLFDEYSGLIYTVVVVIVTLLLFILSQTRKIFFQKKRQIILSEKAETDPLTGTKNRDFLMQSLERHIEFSISDNRPLVVCYFDLDNLKQVNDEDGHKAGDRYILTVVDIVQRHIRSGDILCRVGGDEFVIVLPHCSIKKADELWNFIYDALQLKKQSGKLSEVAGISYGSAELNPLHPVSSDLLLEKADHNMYKHKTAKKG